MTVFNKDFLRIPPSLALDICGAHVYKLCGIDLQPLEVTSGHASLCRV